MIVLLCVLFVIGASGKNMCTDTGCASIGGTCTDVSKKFNWLDARRLYDYGATNTTSNALCTGPQDDKDDCCVCLVKRPVFASTCTDKGLRCKKNGGKCVDMKNNDWAILYQEVDITKPVRGGGCEGSGTADKQCCQCFKSYKTRSVGYPWVKPWG